MERSLPVGNVRQTQVGGEAGKAPREGTLLKLREVNGQAEGSSYDYDFIVIGGGSGGLAASKNPSWSPEFFQRATTPLAQMEEEGEFPFISSNLGYHP